MIFGVVIQFCKANTQVDGLPGRSSEAEEPHGWDWCEWNDEVPVKFSMLWSTKDQPIAISQSKEDRHVCFHVSKYIEVGYGCRMSDVHVVPITNYPHKYGVRCVCGIEPRVTKKNTENAEMCVQSILNKLC